METYFKHRSTVSIVGFEQVNVSWYEEKKLKLSLKTIYKQDITTGNTLKKFTNNRFNREKKVFILPGQKKKTPFYKKNSDDLLPRCKMLMARPALGKKDQNNKRYLHCWTREFLPLFAGNRSTRNC